VRIYATGFDGIKSLLKSYAKAQCDQRGGTPQAAIQIADPHCITLIYNHPQANSLWTGSDSGEFLGCRAFAETNKFPEFRVVVQAIEVGIMGRPIQIAVAGRKRLFECIERLNVFS
jgi:hypothetical protein